MSNNSKRYKCPYCEYRAYRIDLITHVGDEHNDMIPKNYTPARIVYNTINKKDHGTCMICHKETKWDEDKQRYDTLCGNPRCKKQYVEMVRSRMVHKYGTYNLLKDPNFQKKMLEGRSISGKYKFEDGGSVGYVGSYEKKFLEFMDKFLHIKSYDIMSPGPNIPYKYKNEEHIWITDFLYVPYNLVFDIKDGGDNPNTRDMKEYREKQTAKEKAIAEYGDYNYIRLTDNKFEQLILLMMELKEKDDEKPIIRINESMNKLHIISSKEDINMITESYNEIPKFESDKELSDFMKKNIFYKNYTKLMSPEDVYSTKRGSCHDQVMFELYCLRQLKLKPKALFLIEYNDTGRGNSNVTHSLVYYEKNNKTYWFENAWGGQEGIHEFNSLDDLKQKITDLHNSGKFGNVSIYPELEFRSFKTHKPGETLQELVNKCLSIKESSVNEFVSSKVIDDYESKQDMNISSFARMEMNAPFIQIYKKDYPSLSHIRINNNTKGCIWVDDKKRPVAIINTERKDDDYIWINAFEIFGGYKGHGLSKQILRYAIKEYGITHLSVNKNNEIAYKLYKQLGFKTYKTTENMYFMCIKSLDESYIEESNQNLTIFNAYHLEPKIKSKDKIYGDWDE